MVETLPHAVRLRLEQALAQWRHWRDGPAQPPQPEARLEQGISNTSIRVVAGDRRWVVRLDKVNPVRLGISRAAEWHALEHAAAAQISPQPSYYNPDIGVLVCDFCEATDTPEGAEEIADVAGLLRTIHTLPAVRFRLDPLARAQRYASIAGSKPTPDFIATCERLANGAPTPVLCHNDLLRANRLRSHAGNLLALDWEYVAMGDPLLDLAAVIEGDSLDDASALRLLELWLEDSATEAQLSRLADQRLIYRELGRLWEAAFQRLSNPG
jgi:aminoglycoside phosphotransferase (APT) family kinase protein